MSNTMPFIMSSSPPPIDDCEEDDDDEFGDFRVAGHDFSLTDLNQTCDSSDKGKSWTESTVINSEEINSEESTFSSDLPAIQNEDINSMANNNEAIISETTNFEKFPETKISNEIISETSNSVSDKSEETKSATEDLTFQCTFSLQTEVNLPLTNSHSSSNENLEVKNKNENTLSDTSFPVVFDIAQDQLNNVDSVRNEERNGNLESFTSTGTKACDVGATEMKESEVVSDDFSDFTDFTSGSVLNNLSFQTLTDSEELPGSKINDLQSHDDFDDFDDFESAEFKGTIKEELTIEETVKMMFPNSKEEPSESETNLARLTDSLHSCLDDSSSVWGLLKELETSHALSYQWSNSAAHKIFLSSLNIDCTNILFRARWNLCVPRFAANLGVNPLEPVKATETIPASEMNSTPSSSTVEDAVPVAQFDWTSSGLTNPLDGLEKDQPSSLQEPTTSSVVVDSLDVEPLKPVVGDIFESIADEVLSKKREEFVLPPSISSPSKFSIGKRSEMSPEAYAVVESFPDLSFLSARKLMHAADENMSRWRVRP